MKGSMRKKRQKSEHDLSSSNLKCFYIPVEKEKKPKLCFTHNPLLVLAEHNINSP